MTLNRVNKFLIDPSYTQEIEDKIDTKTGDLTTLKDEIKDALTIDGQDINLVNAINYSFENGGGNIELGNVSNLTLSSNQTATQVTVNWQNPIADEFLGVEVFYSTNDITNSSIEHCQTNATKIADDNVTSASFNSTHGQLYYVKVFAKYTIFGNVQYSKGIASNILPQDVTPPNTITNFIANAGDSYLDLNWTNPTNTDFLKVKILYKTNSYPTNENDGIVAYEGSGTNIKLTGLTNETTYYIRAFTYDTNFNINSDTTNQQITAIPKNVKGITNFNATKNLAGNQVTLNWTNPVESTLTKIEMYVAEIDLSSKTRAECITLGTKIVDSKIETYDYTTQPNKTYYFKAFAIHDVNSKEEISIGDSTFIYTEDEQPPNPITNFKVDKEDNGSITLSWINPTDADFNKTRILYKTDSYPTSPTDGTIASDSSVSTVTVNGLTNDTTYYFRAFTYDNNGNVNTSTTGQQITGVPSDVKIYGVKINTLDSNPETSVTYTDNAIGFTPASGNNGSFNYGSWQDKFPFNQIKPCVFKNGAVNYYLNPNDYTKKIDGTNADITTGNDGDVMVEFPKIWWKFETIGNDLYVRYATKQVDSSWKCHAHTRGVTEKDFIYISAYMGYETGGKLRSLSGKTPTVNKTIGAFRTIAQANGTGYEQMAYYQLLMLQVLFIVMFKNRDSQSALGRGYVDGNSASTITGGANTKGMFYGETTGKQQNKFCGIEDFWGNTFYWIDGLFSDANRNILIGTNNFNDTGSGYVNYGQGATSDIGGYIGKVQGSTETGFIIKDTIGSQTTHYCDYGSLYASRLPLFGGDFGAVSAAGAFRLYIYLLASGSGLSYSARSLYL